MKTAIYIEQGTQQIVLTPENEFEKNIVKSIASQKSNVDIYQGSFYNCNGGWVRQQSSDTSLIITKRDNNE